MEEKEGKTWSEKPISKVWWRLLKIAYQSGEGKTYYFFLTFNTRLDLWNVALSIGIVDIVNLRLSHDSQLLLGRELSRSKTICCLLSCHDVAFGGEARWRRKYKKKSSEVESKFKLLGPTKGVCSYT